MKTVQISVRKEMRKKKKKQVCLTDQFQKLNQCRRRYSSSCYSKDARCFVETNNIHSLTSEPRLRKFSNRYNNTVCHMSSFLPDDETTKSIHNIN